MWRKATFFFPFSCLIATLITIASFFFSVSQTLWCLQAYRQPRNCCICSSTRQGHGSHSWPSRCPIMVSAGCKVLPTHSPAPCRSHHLSSYSALTLTLTLPCVSVCSVQYLTVTAIKTPAPVTYFFCSCFTKSAADNPPTPRRSWQKSQNSNCRGIQLMNKHEEEEHTAWLLENTDGAKDALLTAWQGYTDQMVLSNNCFFFHFSLY